MITELDCHRIIVLHLIECISTETIMRRGRHIILYYYLYKSNRVKRNVLISTRIL